MIENYDYIDSLTSSEQWFDVKFDGVDNNRYSISSYGRMMDVYCIFKSSYSSTNGHDYDLISINGKLKLIPVEVLMLSTFYNLDIQTIYKNIKIIHKDGDLRNNNLSNLDIEKADECWSHISDEYFSKEDLKKLELRKIEIICETLVKNNMNINDTFEELKDSMRYLIPRFVTDICHKHSYTEISKLYF